MIICRILTRGSHRTSSEADHQAFKAQCSLSVLSLLSVINIIGGGTADSVPFINGDRAELRVELCQLHIELGADHPARLDSVNEPLRARHHRRDAALGGPEQNQSGKDGCGECMPVVHR